MEELLRLEKLQKIMDLMESHGIINSTEDGDPNSHLFLANFAIFLVESYTELDMEAKCRLISEQLPKISTSFFAEAQKWVGEEGNGKNESTASLHYDDEPGYNSLIGEAATVGLDAMQRANSTLEDFCRSYCMFHDMDVHQPDVLFKNLPVLSFTESYVYQLDTLNEMLVLLQSPAYEVDLKEGESYMDRKAKERWEVRNLKLLKTDPFKPLVTLLEHRGLITERIIEELRSGLEYWALERKLCSSSLSSDEVTIEDVMRAIHLKSFDYRVLNLLLYQLRREQVNEVHMEFLSVSEFLVELSDDLFDYEDDVVENNFNSLRMFVRVYGPSRAPMMLAKCIAEAEEKYEKLLKLLDTELSIKYLKRCEDATREGGKTSGPSLGTWNIPAIIPDEDSYRSEILKTKPSTAVTPSENSVRGDDFLLRSQHLSN